MAEDHLPPTPPTPPPPMAEVVPPPFKRSKPVLDDANEVVRLVREQPPAHCILKVGGFSQLRDALSRSEEDHFETTEFTVGGHRWVMSVYPNGNEKEQGSGHLLLYVALVDKLNCGNSISVSLRFFIHDQIRDNYLTVLDLKEKRFTVIKSVWGIPKLLSLDSFTDASNGFLVDDCCVLGAEVLVINRQVKTSTLSVVKEYYDWEYTWKIEKFSEVKDELFSPVFTIEGWSWKLILYPEGNGKNGKCISLFLFLENHHNLTYGSKLYVKFGIILKNQVEGGDHEKFTETWFSSSTNDWGFNNFIPLTDLHKESNGFIVDDSLILEVDIEMMFILKDMAIPISNTPFIPGPLPTTTTTTRLAETSAPRQTVARKGKRRHLICHS